jgi:hypothetical protein
MGEAVEPLLREKVSLLLASEERTQRTLSMQAPPNHPRDCDAVSQEVLRIPQPVSTFQKMRGKIHVWLARRIAMLEDFVARDNHAEFGWVSVLDPILMQAGTGVDERNHYFQ